MKLRIGLIGLGNMGQNHARVIIENDNVGSLVVLDADPLLSRKVAGRLGAEVADHLDQFSTCDGVVVATATDSHKEIAETVLQMRVPLLIEKPLCSTFEETEGLVRLARELGIALSCGFVERFNPAVSTALNLIDSPVRHLQSFRHSPRNPRASSDVVTDLLIHDLDLTARVAPHKTEPKITSTRWTPVGHSFSETADALLQFGTDMVATQSASRWSQRKIREVRISTDELLIEVDLLRGTVTTYRHKTQSGGTIDPASYKSETVIEVPFVRHTGEPLVSQFNHFLSLISGDVDKEAELYSILKPHQWAQMILL